MDRYDGPLTVSGKTGMVICDQDGSDFRPPDTHPRSVSQVAKGSREKLTAARPPPFGVLKSRDRPLS